MRLASLGLLLMFSGWTGCNLPPKDPFVSAERAMRRNDLLWALRAYDAVPVAHARYPEARAAAGVVESRMRRCHELILEGLMLRGEWRDREALAVFQLAREQWAVQPNLDQWVEATERRLLLFAGGDAPGASPETSSERPAVPLIESQALDQPQGAPVAGEPQSIPGTIEPASESVEPSTSAAAPQPEPGSAIARPAPAGETRPVVIAGRRDPEQRPGVEPQPAPVARDEQSVVAARGMPNGEDPIALALVAIEGRLGRGELGGAIGDLIELSRRFPRERRVSVRFVRLLNQRALVNYGRGAVAAAIADWERVLAIDPAAEPARSLHRRALEESASLRKRRRR